MNSSGEHLAYRVPKEETGEALEHARVAGIYDDERSVERRGDSTLVPVTKEDGFYSTVRVENPSWRKKGIESYLPDGFDFSPPSGWKKIGDVILVHDKAMPPKEKTVGEALLELHGEATSVFVSYGVSGSTRQPSLRHVAGENTTETVHRENGFEFELDLEEVMFSVGNSAERRRIREVTSRDEDVFDMFAGIGYFTVPAASAGADVVAAEINPAATRYLERNLERNEVKNKVDIQPGDCRDIETEADRILMGHFDALEYLASALDALKPEGGILHLHGLAPPKSPLAMREDLDTELKTKGYNLDGKETSEVKTYSEGLSHVVTDLHISAE